MYITSDIVLSHELPNQTSMHQAQIRLATVLFEHPISASGISRLSGRGDVGFHDRGSEEDPVGAKHRSQNSATIEEEVTDGTANLFQPGRAGGGES